MKYEIITLDSVVFHDLDINEAHTMLDQYEKSGNVYQIREQQFGYIDWTPKEPELGPGSGAYNIQITFT